MTQQLEDIEAIRKLIADYCFYTDAHDPDRLCELFTEEFALTGKHGTYEGKAGMRALHTNRGGISEMRHLTINPVIEVNGNEGTGRSYIVCLDCTNGPAFKVEGAYHDRYVKVDGKWLFASRHIHEHPAHTLD
jgi:hypothetical protein